MAVGYKGRQLTTPVPEDPKADAVVMDAAPGAAGGGDMIGPSMLISVGAAVGYLTPERFTLTFLYFLAPWYCTEKAKELRLLANHSMRF